MKIKNGIALLLIAVLIFPVFYITNAEEQDYTAEISELQSIGIFEKNFQPNDLMSRGEFAKIIVRLFGMQDEELSADEQIFSDVPVGSDVFNAVSFCAKQGNMNGYADGTFAPEQKILAEEAIKVLTSILGYDFKAVIAGGYPTGYIYAANDIELTKGITLPYGENLLKKEVAKLISNAIFIPLVSVKAIGAGQSTYEISKDKTLLSEYLHMKKECGIVTATDITGIFGYDACSDNNLMLNGETYYFKDNILRTYLGYHIEIIYAENEAADRKEIVTYLLSEKNKTLIVHQKDFVSIEGGKFFYDDLSREKTVSVTTSVNFEFVYNEKTQNYDEALLENAENGVFELISNDSSNTYSIVKFNAYQTLVVDRIGNDKKILYNTDGTFLSFDDIDCRYTILDEEKKNCEFSSVKKFDVITYVKNGNDIFAFKSSKNTTGIVISKEDSEKSFLIGSKNYLFSNREAETKFFNSVDLNSTVTAYLDIYSRIAYITVSKADDSRILVIPTGIDISTSVGEEVVKLKAYFVDRETIEIHSFHSNVTVNGQFCKNITGSELNRKIAIGTPILIKLNSDSVVTEFETPKNREAYSEVEDGLTTMVNNESLYYMVTQKGFGNKVYHNSATKYLVIPDTADLPSATEKDFMKGVYPASNVNNKLISAYAYSKEDVYAALILESYSNSYGAMSLHQNAGVVIKSAATMNEEGVNCLKIYYTIDNKEEYFYLKDDMLKDTCQDKFYAKDLRAGDIIKVNKDQNNELVTFDCIYKADQNEFYTQYPYVSQANRIIMANVKKIQGDFIHLDVITNLTEGTEFVKYNGLSFTAIKNNGQRFVVSEAQISDVEIGDSIILQVISQVPKRVFILKKNG